jgi:hypothetical protein
MKPFREKFMAKVNTDLVAPLEREFGIKLSEYAALAQGQLTVAVTRNGWEGQSDQKPGFLLLLDARDKSDQLKTNLADLRTKWLDSGKQIKTDKIRDIEFTTLIFSSDDLKKTLDKAFPDRGEKYESLDQPEPKKPARKMEWLIGQSESLFILGSSAKDIEKVLVLQSGGPLPSLAEEASFAANCSALFRESLAYGWFNAKAFFDVLAKQKPADSEQAEPNPFALKLDKVLAATGLSGLQTISFNFEDSPAGCLAHLQVAVPQSSRKGLFKLLSYDAKEASPPPFVPAEAVKFTRWRLDLQKTWATLENMLTEIMPQMAGVIKLFVDNTGKDKDPNFDLRKNLIGNLGDDIITYEKPPRTQTLAGLESPPSLVLISSPRAEQLASAVKALASLTSPEGASKLKEREFLGRTVYAMGLPPLRSRGRPVDRTLHFAASGGYVALSTDVGMLEDYLRSGGSSGKALRETSGLSEAAERVGGMSTGLFTYENQAETMRAALEILKKESGTLANLFGNSPIAGRLGMEDPGKKLKDWADFSLLPSFDKIAKYFHFTVGAGSVDANGIHFKVFNPTPPQLRK